MKTNKNCDCPRPSFPKDSDDLPKGYARLNLDKIKKQDFMEAVIFFWIANSTKVQEAFKPIFQRDISPDDFEMLTEHSESGTDISSYGVEFKKILLYKILFNTDEMTLADTKIFYTHKPTIHNL